MIRAVYAFCLLLVMVAILTGCTTTPREQQFVVGTCEVKLYHPVTPKPPVDPGVKVVVITKERLENGELADTAYVGFEYNQWLEFAKWMHEYEAYSKELKLNLKVYAEQDSRAKKELPTDQ